MLSTDKVWKCIKASPPEIAEEAAREMDRLQEWAAHLEGALILLHHAVYDMREIRAVKYAEKILEEKP